MSAFTSGPWTYRTGEYDDWGTVRAAPDKDGRSGIICQARDPYKLDQETLSQHRRTKTDPWEANARLISAAPQLHYVATLVSELGEVLGENNAVVQLARAALAKASPSYTHHGSETA